MTVSIEKKGWLELYTEMREPAGSLQRMFTPKRGAFSTSTSVTIDIKRFGEPVAVVVTKATGVNFNDISKFTTKEFTPPEYGEGFQLDADDLYNREAGTNEYDAAYAENAGAVVAKMMDGFMVVDAMINRAVELQASQILQTGKLDLVDDSGATRYNLDFKPKATHFPTVGTAWSNHSGSSPLTDLESICDVIRADGKINPKKAILGALALKNFLANDEVKARADIRRYSLIDIAPEMADSGLIYYGNVMVGTYDLELWTYPETYEDPQTGNPTKYISDHSAVVIGDGCRLDMCGARIPRLLPLDPRLAGLVPGRLSSRTGGFDINTNVYASENGEQLKAELKSRVLLAPIQIDGFGCINTNV
jgi:hypothetical protein